MITSDTMNRLTSFWSSVIIGGMGAGLVSLIPVINFINLFFMAWMGLGGALATHRLIKLNRNEVRIPDALVTGAMTGLLAGLIFSGMFYFAFISIPMEKMDAMIRLLQSISHSMATDMESVLAEENIQKWLPLTLFISLFTSILAGMAGAVLCRLFMRKKRDA